MPTIYFAIPLDDDCGCCGTCHDRVGDILEATIVDVEACVGGGYSITGVNGFFDDVTWNESTQQWEKLVGTINDGVETLDLYLYINCSSFEGCESWNVVIQTPLGGTSYRVYNGPFFGPGCDPNPDEFGTAVPNTQTDCSVAAPAGINGTVTLALP